MLLSLATLARYGFNERRLTESDFYEICQLRKITVLEEDIKTSFYFWVLGQEFIVIDKKLRTVARAFAQWHELSHALLGSQLNGPRALFMGLCDTKEEYEADAFACIALIPKCNIDDLTFMDECCCGMAQKIYAKRLHLFETYGI